MSKKILVVKSSPNGANSHSNKLVDLLVSKFKDATVVTRDVSKGLPLVTSTMISGFYSDPAIHSDVVKNELKIPNEIVQEFMSADVYVIGVPMYNFGIPASLKSWIDLIVRAGLTFAFSGPGQYKGLLNGKKAHLVLATGGAPIGSDYDLASSYLKQILGFMGVTDVEIHGISGTNIPEVVEAATKKAVTEIEELVV